MGRIDHNKTGDQTGADMDRVNEALKHLELVYCEMEPGSALFFHANCCIGRMRIEVPIRAGR
jgi:ectoine hydroxylase